MGKGLPRSMARGNVQQQELIKQSVALRAVQCTVAGLTGVGFGTVVIGDVPEGNILFLGAVLNVTITGPGTGHTATWSGNVAIGSAPTADATLAGAEVDIIPSTAVGPAVANVSPTTRCTNATPVMLNNTDGSLELNLQMLVADADISANGVVFTITGDLVLLYSMMLDS